jgi:hypothetical protein
MPGRLRKIDVRLILRDHIQTLRDYQTDKLLYSDFLLFFFLPLVLGGAAFWYNVRLRAIAATGLLTASALFVALLLNLLVMVLAFLRTTQGEPTDESLHLRKKLLREITANLSFSILVALALVATALAGLFGLGDDPDLKIGRATTFLLITGASTLVLNLLMILRRMYVLIVKEFDIHKLPKNAS